MGWQTFDDEPGFLLGDDVLAAYLDVRFDPERFRDRPAKGVRAWEGGEVEVDDPVVLDVLTFAWESVGEVHVEGVPSSEVMARLADLAMRRVAAALL